MSAEGTSPPLGARTVSVAMEMVEVEYGVWCDACALSSAAEVTIATTVAGRTSLQTRTVCNGEHL